MAKKKNPVGRPTKYRDDIPDKLLEYFDKPLYIDIIEEKMAASGVVKEVKVRVANDMPLFEGFARSLGVCMDTLNEWTRVYPIFSDAFKVCKGIQKEFVSIHSLGNRYNAGFAKFFAINNLGMREQSHITTENEHTVKDYGLAFDLSKKPEEVAKDNEDKK